MRRPSPFLSMPDMRHDSPFKDGIVLIMQAYRRLSHPWMTALVIIRINQLLVVVYYTQEIISKRATGIMKNRQDV